MHQPTWFGWQTEKYTDVGNFYLTESKQHYWTTPGRAACGAKLPGNYYNGHTSGPRCLKCVFSQGD